MILSKRTKTNSKDTHEHVELSYSSYVGSTYVSKKFVTQYLSNESQTEERRPPIQFEHIEAMPAF